MITVKTARWRSRLSVALRAVLNVITPSKFPAPVRGWASVGFDELWQHATKRTGKPTEMTSDRQGRMAAWVWLAIAGGLAFAMVAWGEYAHFRASRLGFGTAQPRAPRSEAVIVLGFKNRRSDRANALNRWRVRAAVRSADENLARSYFVFCGGTTSGAAIASEAALMGRYAMQACAVREDRVFLEEQSRSTWQNISNAVPLMEDADQIKIVSNSIHALRGRQYLHRQRPDLAARLVRARDYRPGELWALKLLLALHAHRHHGPRFLASSRRELAAVTQQQADATRDSSSDPAGQSRIHDRA